jgi:hypothetical protein
VIGAVELAIRQSISSWLWIGAVSLFLTSGCVQLSETRQLSNSAQVGFPTVPKNSVVRLIGPREYEFSVNDQREVRIEAGSYQVLVEHDGELVLRRTIFLGPGESKAVLP